MAKGRLSQCVVNLRDLYSCTLYLQVTTCKPKLKIKEQEGSRDKSHMNEIGSLQPPLSFYKLLQTLPTQCWCFTSLHEGFKALTWGSLCPYDLPLEMHTQFDLTWYGYLPRGKPQIHTRVHTNAHNNSKGISLWPTQPIPSAFGRIAWQV